MLAQKVLSYYVKREKNQNYMGSVQHLGCTKAHLATDQFPSKNVSHSLNFDTRGSSCKASNMQKRKASVLGVNEGSAF